VRRVRITPCCQVRGLCGLSPSLTSRRSSRRSCSTEGSGLVPPTAPRKPRLPQPRSAGAIPPLSPPASGAPAHWFRHAVGVPPPPSHPSLRQWFRLVHLPRIPIRFSLDTTWGTNHNPVVVIPSKKEQRLTRCGPAEGVSMTCGHGRPKSKFLSAKGDAQLFAASRRG